MGRENGYTFTSIKYCNQREYLLYNNQVVMVPALVKDQQCLTFHRCNTENTLLCANSLLSILHDSKEIKGTNKYLFRQEGNLILKHNIPLTTIQVEKYIETKILKSFM